MISDFKRFFSLPEYVIRKIVEHKKLHISLIQILIMYGVLVHNFYYYRIQFSILPIITLEMMSKSFHIGIIVFVILLIDKLLYLICHISYF